MAILWIVLGLLTSSLTEYLLHRHYLHRKTHHHIKDHHKNYIGDDFIHPQARMKDIASSPTYIFVSLLPTLLIAALLHPFIHWESFFIFLAGGTYLLWVEYAHYVFHTGKGYLPTLFLPLDQHHQRHHQVFIKNYGIGSSFWDYVFSTKEI